VAVTPATALAGIYNAEYFPTIAPAGTYTAGMTAIATNEYWDVSKTSGPGAQVTLQYIASNTWNVGSPSTLDNIYVAHLNAGNWDMAYGTTIAGNTGSGPTPVISTLLTSFSPFTFAYSPITTLPVNLLDFKATVVNQAIDLVWISSGEVALENYVVERAADGSNFYTMGAVAATNTQSATTYTWTDNTPLAVDFYRLKMVDLDGVFRYSNVLKIDMTAKKNMIIYPNPVMGHTVLLQMVGQAPGDYIFSLYNAGGEKVYYGKFSQGGNDGTRTINLNAGIPSGLYYFSVLGPDGKTNTYKLIIN
jgi:hypothetical protein